MYYNHFLISPLPLCSWNVRHKNVLVRIDGNVPCLNNHIMDDFRLLSVLPTLHFLKEKQAQIILLTHRGRPQGVEPLFSNDVLSQWFEQQGFSVFLDTTLTIPSYETIMSKKVDLYILENMRFFSAEKSNDPHFWNQLATSADFYVNDAWGTLHRSDASLTHLPHFFNKQRRSIGFLVAKELNGLQPLLKAMPKCVAVLGGSKIESKAKALLGWVEQRNFMCIELCPPLVLPFLNGACGNGREYNAVVTTLVQAIQKRAQENKTTLLYPHDFLVKKGESYQTFSCSMLNTSDEIVSIGPESIELYCRYFYSTRAVLISGLMGFLDQAATLEPFYDMIKSLAESCAYRVAAGGDTVSAVRGGGYETSFDFLSTGGGSTLTYLAGLPLPALDALQ